MVFNYDETVQFILFQKKLIQITKLNLLRFLYLRISLISPPLAQVCNLCFFSFYLVTVHRTAPAWGLQLATLTVGSQQQARTILQKIR